MDVGKRGATSSPAGTRPRGDRRTLTRASESSASGDRAGPAVGGEPARRRAAATSGSGPVRPRRARRTSRGWTCPWTRSPTWCRGSSRWRRRPQRPGIRGCSTPSALICIWRCSPTATPDGRPADRRGPARRHPTRPHPAHPARARRPRGVDAAPAPRRPRRPTRRPGPAGRPAARVGSGCPRVAPRSQVGAATGNRRARIELRVALTTLLGLDRRPLPTHHRTRPTPTTRPERRRTTVLNQQRQDESTRCVREAECALPGVGGRGGVGRRTFTRRVVLRRPRARSLPFRVRRTHLPLVRRNSAMRSDDNGSSTLARGRGRGNGGL